MSLAPRLDLRQSQSLVMTPQLQQAIKLLALSNLEIEGFIAGELERNPLLEVGEERADAPEPDAPRADPGVEAAADAVLGSDADFVSGALDVDATDGFDRDSPSDAGETSPAGTDPRGMDGGLGLDGIMVGGGLDGPDFDSFAAPGATLRDHLIGQAGESLAGADLLIALALIEHVEDSGYLSVDLTELALRLGVARGELERVLALVQRFDPAGVAARDLAECLAIQAREADRYDPCMAALIANLDLLAKGAIPQLKRICRVDDEDFADMVAELRGYDPKPGTRFDRDIAPPIVPDIFVAETAEGWAVELNSASVPKLVVNRTYYQELNGIPAQGKAGKESKAWVGEKLADANWLVKALDQRQRTIIRVAGEIVQRQAGFFRHGVAHLKPLTLRAVAETLSLHESTISRVTSNKFLSCARGTFELKYFFTSAIQAADGGEAVSASAVKDRIARLIGEESAKAILSDDRLVELLVAEGFDIARRTVAKYRENMGIGSSVQRRRQKALGAL